MSVAVDRRGAGNGYEFEMGEWPLVVSRLQRQLHAEEYLTYLSGCERLLANRQVFVHLVLSPTTERGMTGASLRAMTRWMNHNRSRLDRYCAGTVIVTDTMPTAARFVTRMILSRLGSSPTRFSIVRSEATGREHARTFLERAREEQEVSGLYPR